MNSLSEACGESSLNEPQSIVVRFENSVKQCPGNLAIICPHQPPDLYGFSSLPIEGSASRQAPYLRWSYATLGKGVMQFKDSLVARGVVTGTVLFAFCESQVESVICTLAAYAIGCIHVPVGPEYLSNSQEIQHMITAVTTSTEPSNVVFLVGKNEDIPKVDKMDVECAIIKISCGSSVAKWESFDRLIRSSIPDSGKLPKSTGFSREQSVFFTSGTTSLPKACLTETARWLHELESSLSLGSVGLGDMVNVAVPTYHAFGYICTFMPFLRGACVLLVGPKFSPERMRSTLSSEPCTHAALIPTMINALVQLAEDSNLTFPSLKSVIFAGMTMSSSIARKCQEILGISLMENFYGMTEGVFISTGPIADLTTAVLNDTVSIGKPISGTQVRVCEATGRSPVPIGVKGVLHFSGSTLIRQYLDCESDEFYNFENRHWFVTGDQAFMGNDKQLYIVGRHKDMIVRGGKNLSPSRIEQLLNQEPQFSDLEPQVVAGEDDIAGEVPIVVTRVTTSHEMENMMHGSICEKLGIHYTPRAWISLPSLGLDDFPRTASGKIQKAKLRSLVANFMQLEPSTHKNSHLSNNVVTVWSRLLGLQASQLDTSAPIAQVADSILMLSARAKIKSETGLSVSLTEWLALPTIADQIKLLEGIAAHRNNKEPDNSRKELRTGPPRTEDMVHLGEDESAFCATKAAVEKIIGKHGFSWEEVENVFPCTDFVQILCRSQVIDTWNIRTTILSQNASVQAMRTALENTLLMHPMMLSYIITDDKLLNKELGLYVTMRHSTKLLEKCILDFDSVDTLQELRSLAMDYPFKDHAKLPGPLFRCLVIFVRETSSAAVITNSNFPFRTIALLFQPADLHIAAHAILDVTYHSQFHEDLDRALSGQPLRPHSSFKAWAETYHILRKSPIAASTVNFHAKYLTDLQDHKQALWPHPTSQLIVSPERFTQDGHVVSFAAPAFVRLRNQHPMLTTPIVLKAALALMIILHTNHTHALFLNLEAQRARLPFLRENLPFESVHEAADVSGPTFGGVLNLVKFQPTETVLEYLTRIQEEQENLTKYANVPWHELSRQTGHSMEEILPAVAESMIFNWMPGLGPAALGENPYRHMEVKQTHIRTKLGMLASAGAGGRDGSQIVLFLQGAMANLSSLWVERAAEEMKNIALWLATETSLHTQVGEFTKHVT